MLLPWNIHSFLHCAEGFSKCFYSIISRLVTLKYAAVRVLRTGAFWLNFLGHYLWSVTDITSQLQNFLFCFFAFFPFLRSPLRKWSHHVLSTINFSFANILQRSCYHPLVEYVEDSTFYITDHNSCFFQFHTHNDRGSGCPCGFFVLGLLELYPCSSDKNE